MSSTAEHHPTEIHKALFIDDDVNLLTSTKRILRGMSSLGMEMSFHDNPLAAEVIVEHTPTDLMVTDMQMPGIDGAQLIHRLRGVPIFPVVYILTGQADETSLARAFGYAHRVIRKPCSVDHLRSLCEGFRKACETIPAQETRSSVLKQLVTFLRTGMPEPYLIALREHNQEKLADLAQHDRRCHFFTRYIAAYFGVNTEAAHSIEQIVQRITPDIAAQVVMAVTSECRSTERLPNNTVEHSFGEPFLATLSTKVSLSLDQLQTFLGLIWGEKK